MHKKARQAETATLDRPRRTKTAMGPAERGMQSMELKVFKDTIAAYGGRRETRLELPVETEILIPDYLPAVFKIVKWSGGAGDFAKSHGLHPNGRGEGYLRCNCSITKSDEAGAQLYRMEQKFPFEKTADLPETGCQQGPADRFGGTGICQLPRHQRAPALTCGEPTRSMSRSRWWTSWSWSVPWRDCGIEQRTRVLNGKACAAAEEKTFTAETHIAVPGSDAVVLDISGSFQPESVTGAHRAGPIVRGPCASRQSTVLPALRN